VRYTRAARLMWWHNGFGCSRGVRSTGQVRAKPDHVSSPPVLSSAHGPRGCISSADCAAWDWCCRMGTVFGLCRGLPTVLRLATARRCCQCSSGTIGQRTNRAPAGVTASDPAPTPAAHTPARSVDLSGVSSKITRSRPWPIKTPWPALTNDKGQLSGVLHL